MSDGRSGPSRRWRRRCAPRARARCRRRSRASRSTPARIAPGEAFFAIKGDNRDGHDFVAGRARGGRRARGRRRRQARRAFRRMRRCSSCPMCSTACAISRARRARARRRRSSASPARSARPAPRKRCVWRSPRQGETHASAASYNNHWGVPLSLARCPRDRALRGVRDGHEPCRRDRAAHAAGAAACGDHHHGRAGASGILRLGRGDRRRQGGNLPRARARRRGGDQPRQSAIRAARAAAPKRAGVERVVSFGEHARAPTRG